MNHTSELYQIATIKELEKLAITQAQISENELMARAGKAAFNYLRHHWSEENTIAIICGKGNNAGDGYVLARLAKRAGYNVIVYALTSKEQLQGTALNAAIACEEAHVKIQPFSGSFVGKIIVDALLGTGLKGEVQNDYRVAIAAINDANLPVLSLDVPSGLDADTGNILGDAVRATVTVTFIGLKTGLFTHHGPAYAGDIHLDNLQIPVEVFSQVSPQATLIKAAEVSIALPRRHKDAHKGDFGHVLIIGGDYGMAGAARMAGEAAARVGAGLTTVATHPEHRDIISNMRPELMCQAVENSKDLEPLIEKATVIAIGPGLGQSEWSKKILEKVLATKLPKVMDADALNLLAKLAVKSEEWILTPHPGEAARLLNCTTGEIQQDRFKAAAALQQQYGGVIVLKGSGTIVQNAKRIPGICVAGNPGMASGGMGDVLTGVIAGLLAQKLTLEQAARIGVYIHAHAADRAALQGGERGLLAMDLMSYLQRLVNP